MLSMSCRSGISFGKIVRQIHSSKALIAAAAPQSALQQQAQRLALQEMRDHYERIAATTRPISPHLMIYKMEPHMFMSLMHRATGCYMACVAVGFGGISLIWPGWFNWCAAFLAGIHPVFTYFIKFCLSFPFGLHIANGIRHFIQDFGYLLGRSQLAAVHVSAFAFACAFGIAFAAWTLKP